MFTWKTCRNFIHSHASGKSVCVFTLFWPMFWIWSYVVAVYFVAFENSCDGFICIKVITCWCSMHVQEPHFRGIHNNPTNVDARHRNDIYSLVFLFSSACARACVITKITIAMKKQIFVVPSMAQCKKFSDQTLMIKFRKFHHLRMTFCFLCHSTPFDGFEVCACAVMSDSRFRCSDHARIMAIFYV